MIKIQANNLEEAYQEACLKLKCSIVDMGIEIVQYPRNIFGIIKKPAIIKAYVKNNNLAKIDIVIKQKIDKAKLDKKIIEDSAYVDKKLVVSPLDRHNTISIDSVLDSFYQDKLDVKISKIPNNSQDEKILENITKQIKDVFCFDFIDFTLDEVSFCGNKTIYIKFVGKDVAMVIGKNGYRYKALSYLLFSWIHNEYNLFVKVEVGEFLENQNKMIKKHLRLFVEEINTYGVGTTKILDGVLVHLGIEYLREVFPDKMIVIKSNKDNKRYIKVCDFK